MLKIRWSDFQCYVHAFFFFSAMQSIICIQKQNRPENFYHSSIYFFLWIGDIAAIF